MANNTALATRQMSISQYLNSDNVKKHVEGILKDRAPQLMTSLISLSNLTPGLKDCDPKTLLYCGMKAASMDLPLDNSLGFVYAIPYKRGEIVEAQFQPGYRAYIQLAQRTGQYKMINVLEIKVGELISWDPFTEELKLQLIPDQEKRDQVAVLGYAAMFELLNGFKKTIYWPKEKVLKHAKRFSKTYNKNQDRFASYNKYKKEWIPGTWETDFDAMAKKTVIKELISKWGPMSIQLQEAVKFDQAVIRETDDGTEVPDYVDAQYEVDAKEVPENDLEAEFQRDWEEKMKADGASNAN
jgi:recombination protein RecT